MPEIRQIAVTGPYPTTDQLLPRKKKTRIFAGETVEANLTNTK
jgi:hypothetical protein